MAAESTATPSEWLESGAKKRLRQPGEDFISPESGPPSSESGPPSPDYGEAVAIEWRVGEDFRG